MAFELIYHPEVGRDIAGLPRNIKEKIRTAIEARLTTEPLKYGDYLRRGLQGYRKLRLGDYRVIYKVKNDKVVIFKIGHRKEVYAGRPRK